MWSCVVPQSIDAPAPSSRSKHSATLLGGFLYLLGGRNGNIPLKDFWKYNLTDGKWEQLKSTGDTPPCLQEHTAVAYKDCIYVFGGELGFSSGNETPLWVYNVKTNSWRKVKAQKGVSVPKGRRGHTALVYQGAMLVYGGYQDLRGSCSDLWVFDFETESWHLLTGRSEQPPGRHKHSAVIHNGAMWIYGGMTDLNDRSDLWRWDTGSKLWTCIRSKPGPGPLHSHSVCKLPSSMLIFGGEKDRQTSNELWRFHFATETWERLQPSGIKPQPRAESVALAVSELLLAPSSSCSPASSHCYPQTPCSLATTPGVSNTQSSARLSRSRAITGGGSMDRSSSCRPFQSKVSPYFRQNSEPEPTTSTNTQRSTNNIFLSKLTSRLTNRNNGSYSVLSNADSDNNSGGTSNENLDQIPNNTKMIKSASINVKLNFQQNIASPQYLTEKQQNYQKRPISMCNRLEPTYNLPHEPVSVPNFQTALTPVEAARLVFLESDDSNVDSDEEDNNRNFVVSYNKRECKIKPSNTIDFSTLHKSYQPSSVILRNHSKTPTTEDGPSNRHSYHGSTSNSKIIPKSNSVVRFKEDLIELDENTVSSATSDYASIETVNGISNNIRISPDSRNSDCFIEEDDEYEEEIDQENNLWDSNSRFPPARPHLCLQQKSSSNKLLRTKDKPLGFSNPHYLGPDVNTILTGINNNNNKKQKQFSKVLNSPPDSLLEDSTGKFISQDELELHAMTPCSSIDTPSSSTSLPFPSCTTTCSTTRGIIRRRSNIPPGSLQLSNTTVSRSTSLRNTTNTSYNRASSATRAESMRRYQLDKYQQKEHAFYDNDLEIPIYMFLIGGKEHGQVTVFKRPISMWKLELNSEIF